MKASPRPPRTTTGKVRSEDGSFTLSELRRREEEFHSAQSVLFWCLEHPEWKFAGTFAEGRQAAAEHRRLAHRRRR